MPDFALVPADEVLPADLHAAFVAAFSDYVTGPVALPFDRWPATIARQVVELTSSRVAVREGSVLAFALVSPRAQGRRWRLAAMGATPEARGSGAAPALLDDFIARAAAASQTAVELECFVANERAQRLYRGRGFAPRCELIGYELAEGADVAAPVSAASCEVGRDVGYAWLDAAERRLQDLPLQVTRPSLEATARPLRFLQRGDAQLVWSDTGDGARQVHSLIDATPEQADAQALIGAMCATRPGAAVSVPAIQRTDLGGAALLRLGLVAQPFHQVLMVRTPL
ncbi:MAG: GNAT family N-acetyltransferase [Proteobacteria bacterium]|nr:GNAT family N-acetyltransferase [Pseudomonadota bacterium]